MSQVLLEEARRRIALGERQTYSMRMREP